MNSNLFQKVLRRIFDSVVTPRRVSISDSVAKSVPNLRKTDFVMNLPVKINYKLIKKNSKRSIQKYFKKNAVDFLCCRNSVVGFYF